MKRFRPISWFHLASLGVSFRWVQGDKFLDVLSGNCQDSRDLPLLERVPIRSTWVDDRDMFREMNRVIGDRWPEWQRHHGLVRPDTEPPPAPAPRQALGLRSTDFVRRSS